MREPLEKDIQADILQYLALEGIFAWENPRRGVFDPKRKVFRKKKKGFKEGVADILGLLDGNGRILCIECKRPGNKLTDDQETFRDDIIKRGGVAFMATSVKDVQDGLRQFGVKLAIDLQNKVER